MAWLDNLQMYLRMDEPSGIAGDAHSNNHLQDNNTVTSAPGKLGLARQFTAANSEYLSIADNAALSVGDIDFTACAWVYLDTKGSGVRRISGQYDYGNNQRSWSLYYDQATDRFLFVVSADGTSGTITIVSANSFGSPSTGTWYYIAAWHDATANTINIQVNNGMVDSTTHTTGVYNSTAQFRIGSLSNNGSVEASGNCMDGRIDGVGFWKRVLTSTERTDLYNGGSGLDYPFTSASALRAKCTHYWRADATSGTRGDAQGDCPLLDFNGVTSATGVINNGASFVTASSQALYNQENLASLRPGDNSFGFSFWFKLADKTTSYAFISKEYETAAQSSFVVYFDQGNDKIGFGVYDSGGVRRDVTIAAPAASTLTHCCAWYDAPGDTVNICLNNGTAQTLSSIGPLQAGGDAILYLGARQYSSSHLYYNGLIDEVSMYNDVLTSGDRTNLYNSGAGLAYPLDVAAGGGATFSAGKMAATARSYAAAMNAGAALSAGKMAATARSYTATITAGAVFSAGKMPASARSWAATFSAGAAGQLLAGKMAATAGSPAAVFLTGARFSAGVFIASARAPAGIITAGATFSAGKMAATARTYSATFGAVQTVTLSAGKMAASARMPAASFNFSPFVYFDGAPLADALTGTPLKI